MTGERMEAVFMVRRNGAWLLSGTDGGDVGLPPSDLYDAAGSLKEAKRAARRLATELGFTGAARWTEQKDGRVWVLEMTWPDDPEDEVRY